VIVIYGERIESKFLRRLRYTAEQKQALIEAYETSGLSSPRFAAMHGVNYQTQALNRAPLAFLPEFWRLWHPCCPALNGLAGVGAGFEPVGGQEVFELLLRWSCA
jgi:hypothetical protein